MSFAEFLDPNAIVLNLKAKTAEDVIRQLGGHLLSQGAVKNDFVDATLAREAEMPTGLPLGGSINAAIPHVDIEYVNRSALALATLPESVTFQNMVDPDESVPVRLVIMLALSQPKSQIEMLQRVAGILQDTAVVEQLMAADSPQAVLEILDGAA